MPYLHRWFLNRVFHPCYNIPDAAACVQPYLNCIFDDPVQFSIAGIHRAVLTEVALCGGSPNALCCALN